MSTLDILALEACAMNSLVTNSCHHAHADRQGRITFHYLVTAVSVGSVLA